MNPGAFWRFLKHAARQYSADNCAQLAAAISYYVLFSIVPLTFVMVSVFGLVIRGDRLRAEVVERVVESIGLEKGEVSLDLDQPRLLERLSAPRIEELRLAIARMDQAEREALAAAIRAEGGAQAGGEFIGEREVLITYKNSISDTLSQVASASAPLTAFSLFFSAWSGSAMFGAVRKAINVVWKAQQPRAYFQQKALDLLMVLAFGVLMLASVFGTAALRALREISDEALSPLSSGAGVFWGVVPFVLPGIVSFIVFALLYRLVPSTRIRFRDVWLGALVAAILFEVLKNGFAFYVANFRAYDLLYGSLGGILLFLTAVYFASAILLFGGELAATMPGLGAGAFDATFDPDRPKLTFAQSVRREAVGVLGWALRAVFWMPRHSEREPDGSEPRAGPPKR